MAEGIKIIGTNRKARHDFHIEQTMEAGIALQGSEVKSLREGKVNLQDAFCTVVRGEVLLMNCHISPYHHASQFSLHDPMRPRKLLLHAREIEQLDEAIAQKGLTIVPLQFYFKNGRVKVEIGVARGKKLYDKRADIAERDTRRRLERVIRAGRDE